MARLALVDASALVAALDRREVHHDRCAEVLRRRDLDLIVPALVIAEVAHFADERLGPKVEAAFVGSLERMHVEAPEPADWPVIAALVDRYATLRLGTVDASIAVLADRLGTNLVITLDRRHFETLRSPEGRAFEILPAPLRAHEDPAAYDAGQA